jgi:hypothetical protein
MYPTIRKITLSSDAPVLKIAVMANGSITADNSPVTIESLRDLLKTLAERKGVVWYYREACQSKAPVQARHVMQAVVENRLPVRLSTRPDYSNSVGPGGKPIGKDGKQTDV